MIQIKQCPICESSKLETALELDDYFLSKESFTIQKCSECGFKFTNPYPDLDKLGAYYKSEEYISHSNTKKGLFSSLYQFVRSYTLRKKFDLIRSYNSKGSILDIGCATGEFLNVFKLAKWETEGIEPDADARKMATDNYDLKIGEEQDIKNIESESKDVITMWHVLEHVPDLNQRMEDLHRILKADGTIFIAVPNYKCHDEEIYGKYWAAYDVPRHLYHFSPESMTKLLAKHNLFLQETKPMKFDSFYVSLLSEEYKNGKKSFPKAFINGLKSNWKAANTGDYSSLIYVVKKSEM
jgi:2-polyprenyl-3-methyl-5-hydroxy-6-metoxy-1,4-benzoquinol methylase